MNPFFSKVIFKGIPRILSSIFHPLLMPTLGVYVILNSGMYLSLMEVHQKLMILLMIFISTFGLPVAFIPFYYYHKIISSVEIADGKERSLPLLITGTLYYIAYLVLHYKGMPDLIQSFILSSAVIVFLNMLINLRWKISSHMMGIGGVIGLVIVLSVVFHADVIVFLMIAILLGGLIAYARLSLDAHTPSQVYTGLATGILVVILTLEFFRI